ncbi:MAG: hypothetical protein ACJ0TD_06300 [Arenicellales bacterium]
MAPEHLRESVPNPVIHITGDAFYLVSQVFDEFENQLPLVRTY